MSAIANISSALGYDAVEAALASGASLAYAASLCSFPIVVETDDAPISAWSRTERPATIAACPNAL